MVGHQLVVRHIESLGDRTGALSVTYCPDQGLVSLCATIPGDLRRAGIVVRTNIESLRKLVDSLEQEAEIAKRQRDAMSRPLASTQGSAVFRVMGLEMLVPDDVVTRVKRLIERGSANHDLLREVRLSFPTLKDEAVSELTHLLYIQFRPRA